MHVHAVSRFRFDAAFELKLARAFDDHDVRHLHWLWDDLLDAVVVVTGSYAYRWPDAVTVVPAESLWA